MSGVSQSQGKIGHHTVFQIPTDLDGKLYFLNVEFTNRIIEPAITEGKYTLKEFKLFLN